MTTSGRAKKIALLDDSDLIRDLVRETLQERGYEVVDSNTPFGFSNLLRREKRGQLVVEEVVVLEDG